MDGIELYVVMSQAVAETLAVIFLVQLIRSHHPFFTRLRHKWLVREMLWRAATVWALACLVGAMVFTLGFRWYTASAISLAHVVVLCLYVGFVVPYLRPERPLRAGHR
jgi:hypothetical protein